MIKKTTLMILLSALVVLLFGCSGVDTNTTLNTTTQEATTITPTSSTEDITEDTTTESFVGFMDVDMGYEHVVALSESHRVYAWGVNVHGQLGDGSTTRRTEPVDITNSFSLLLGEVVVEIGVGHMNSMALTSFNRLFIWGSNANGQISNQEILLSQTPIDITDSLPLNDNERIIKFDLGAGHIGVLTSQGRLFSWGYNKYGQVGNRENNNSVYTPVDITNYFGLRPGETIIDMSYGYMHSSALTSENRIFTWGYNTLGQMGDWSTVHKNWPIDISSYFILDEQEVIEKISMGYYHSSAISSLGKVFTWGYNEYGQLGVNAEYQYNMAPQNITDYFDLDEEETILNIYLGGWHSSAISTQGQLFMWGMSNDGRLAIDSQDNIYLPTPINDAFSLEEEERIVEISLGSWSSIALTNEGRLFAWGYNNDGRLGIGTLFNSHEPLEIKIEE